MDTDLSRSESHELLCLVSVLAVDYVGFHRMIYAGKHLLVGVTRVSDTNLAAPFVFPLAVQYSVSFGCPYVISKYIPLLF